MPSEFITANLVNVVAARSKPGVTYWNRLEGRPRAQAFDRALRAEVRDPLWMLTKQWQLGEFAGDDAGSPITAKVRADTTRIATYQPQGQTAEPFDNATPLEARVEQLPVPFAAQDVAASLDLRLLMGRYWLKLIGTLAPAARAEYVTTYPIDAPNPTTDAAICAHPEAWSTYLAASARLMDGAKLYAHLAAGGLAADGIGALIGLETQANALGERFSAWFRELIYQPEQTTAWQPDRMEYSFQCGLEGSKKLTAQEYYHGHLDWYNFSVTTPTARIDPVTPQRLSMLPTALTFPGMPNTRWWAFEDNRTNFGDIAPDTTDLAKLVLIEFALVYANDWFLVPFTVPAGSVATVRGVEVTNVFGERTWVEAAGRGDDADWKRWAMYLMSVEGAGSQPADLSLAILPTAQKVLDGRPLDDVLLARDEMANMVWAVEQSIPLPTGAPKSGAEAGHQTHGFYVREYERVNGTPPTPPPLAPGAKVRYRLMSSVPEHWIPLVPMHRSGDTREIQLQRASMPRLLADDDPNQTVVKPRTWLMRQGLDGTGPDEAYFLHEEEVPRSGVRVTRAFQRTRWRDGKAWVWLGARKQTGRGGGSSGLAFDQIIDIT